MGNYGSGPEMSLIPGVPGLKQTETLSQESDLDLELLTSGGLVLVEYDSQAKPSEPDRTAFDLQHICMKLHRGNGLRRQPAAMSVHLLISCVLTPGCEPSPQLKYLHITMDSFEWADETRCFSVQLWSRAVLWADASTRKIHGKDRKSQFGLEKQPPVSLFHPFPSSLRLTRFYL